MHRWHRRYGSSTTLTMKIKKNDIVQILLGKDRGKTGKILRVFPKKEKALVEGVNLVKRHIKKMGEREGGILDIAKPVNISNVAIVCPNCKKPTRVGYKIEGNTKMRVCRKCKEVLDGKVKG